MMYCQTCGLFFLDEETKCPECGEPLMQTVQDDPAQTVLSEPSATSFYANRIMVPSHKKRNTVILLAYFLGVFGAHRFYLGKIFTAVLMLLTFGGLTIWYCIDFVKAVYGSYTDSQGRVVDKSYNSNMVLILIIAPIVLLVVGVIVLFFVASFLYETPISINF
jgi:TM2 domain-containing membrane protein YozV